MSHNYEEYEKIAETPRTAKVESSYSFGNSHDSIDSGYLSFASQSSNHVSSYQSKLSSTSFRRLRRSQSKSCPYKGNRKLNISESHIYDSSDISDSISKSPNKRLSSTLSTLPSNHSKLDYSRSHSMELRSHKRRCIQSTSLITETAFNYGMPSPPSSHTVPLSPLDYKSINIKEDKLVISQSTPCVIKSPTLPTSLCSVVLSPIDHKTSPVNVSVNRKKLSFLSISEHLPIPSHAKPKKLDFSKRAILESFLRERVIPDYTGKDTVDILKVLGIRSNHPDIVSKILSYLSSQDLCSVSMVSRSWQKICNGDAKSKERRLKHIILKQYCKENLLSISRSKREDIQMSPKSRYPKRGCLTPVHTNLLQTPKVNVTPNSPPVSPSKVIFHSFVKAGRSLAPRDQLVPCPQCKFACRVEHERNIGKCSRPGCPMGEFCLLCSSKVHIDEPCKMPLLATPTKRGRHQQSVVGTKQCKRNLRRISRLI